MRRATSALIFCHRAELAANAIGVWRKNLCLAGLAQRAAGTLGSLAPDVVVVAVPKTLQTRVRRPSYRAPPMAWSELVIIGWCALFVVSVAIMTREGSSLWLARAASLFAGGSILALFAVMLWAAV